MRIEIDPNLAYPIKLGSSFFVVCEFNEKEVCLCSRNTDIYRYVPMHRQKKLGKKIVSKDIRDIEISFSYWLSVAGDDWLDESDHEYEDFLMEDLYEIGPQAHIYAFDVEYDAEDNISKVILNFNDDQIDKIIATLNQMEINIKRSKLRKFDGINGIKSGT